MTERQTYAVPAHEQWFVHETGLLPLTALGEARAPGTGPPMIVSRCMTRRPGARCECGMFTLDWETEERA